MRTKVQAVANELRGGRLTPEPGKVKLIETRRRVTSYWLATAAALRAQGEGQLAREVEDFVRAMPRVGTEKEQIAAGLLAQIQAHRQRGNDHGQVSSRKPGE